MAPFGGAGSAGASGASGSAGVGGVPGSAGASGGPVGGTAGTGGQGGSAPSPSEFWSRFRTALCHHYLNCYGENFGGQDLRALGGEAECATALEKWLSDAHPRIAGLSRAVASGTLRIQGGLVEQCLEAVSSCTYPLAQAPREGELGFDDVTPCREVFEGSVPSGGECDISEECAGDAMCVVDPAAAACAGSCQPRKEAGQDCTVDRQCGAPSPTAWAVCQEKKCIVANIGPLGAVGDECGRLTDKIEPCASGWCPAGAFGIVGLDHCKAPLAIGGACFVGTGTFDLECAQGYCDQTCKPFVVQKSVGDSCTVGGELCDSFSSLYCGGTCKRADGTTPGTCNAIYWFQQALCPPPVLSSDGSSCTSHESCASGICRAGHGCISTLCSAH